MNLQTLRLYGFDESERIPFTRTFRPHCSQCEALVINGYASHETGCPNARHECAGCNEILPVQRKYCGDCT